MASINSPKSLHVVLSYDESCLTCYIITGLLHTWTDKIATLVVDAAFQIHNTLCPGLLKSVYEQILASKLENEGLQIEVQKKISIVYEDMKIENAFRADLLINDLVIIELKSVEKLEKVHFKQLLTYLRLSNKKLGLLINFNTELIKNGIKRVVNNL